MRNITQVQKESIVLDAAIVFADYGESTAREIGITKGGVEFNVTENVREIEYDGKRGKTKGMEVVDSIDAYLKLTTLELTQDNILATLGAAEADEVTGAITNTTGGVIPSTAYLTNITAFGICNKTGAYKKITLYNANAAGGLTIKTTDKGEATIDTQFNAHWNPLDVSDPIYKIEDSNVTPTGYDVLREIEITSTAGDTDESIITIHEVAGSGMGFVYLTAETTAPTVTYEQDLSAWTAIISGETITPTEGHTKITVAEVDADKKAYAAGSATLSIGA